jgi:hypothetical protein
MSTAKAGSVLRIVYIEPLPENPVQAIVCLATGKYGVL